MLSYNNDPSLKALLVEEIERHRLADQIVQGTYGEGEGAGWRGCAVGCSIHSLNLRLERDYATDDHSVYEKALGIPEWLARLEDRIFEGLPFSEAKLWPGRLAAAIPVGVDLRLIKNRFCVFVLRENLERVRGLSLDDALKNQVSTAIERVLALHEQESAESAAWSAAESAAWSAAASAARSAWSAAESAARSAWSAAESAAESAWSAAASAACSAARSAESAARSAAWSARSTESATRSAARSAESAESARSAAQRYSAELLRLLENAI